MKTLAATLITLALTVTPAHADIEAAPTVEFYGEQVPATLDLWNWGQVAECESSGRWHYRGRYRGGLQFWPATWRSVGGEGDPADATIAEQLVRARLVLDRDGWGAWPTCSKRLGYR